MTRLRYDRILAAAAALFALAMAWCFRPWEEAERPGKVFARAAPVAVREDDGSAPAAAAWSRGVWNAPSAEHGHFDLFTPPFILIDRERDRFVIASTSPGEPASAGFELELLAIVQEPFRLQLVGYVGEPDNCLGVFENALTGETKLARAGHTFSDLALRVDAFELRRERAADGAHTPLTQWSAAAAISDLRTGERIQLTTLVRRTVGPARARVRVRATAELHDVPSGAELVLDSTRFRVGALREEPLALEVTRFSSNATAETRWLTPEP